MLNRHKIKIHKEKISGNYKNLNLNKTIPVANPEALQTENEYLQQGTRH